MSTISDFSPEDLKAVNETLLERYGEVVAPERVDVELRLTPDDSQVTECPALYWEKGNCHFILAKTSDSQYYSQFFYDHREQYGTGRQYYDDLLDCLITTLRVQADHELERNQVKDLHS